MEWKVHLENESKSYFDSIYFDEFTWDQYFNILHSRQKYYSEEEDIGNVLRNVT